MDDKGVKKSSRANDKPAKKHRRNVLMLYIIAEVRNVQTFKVSDSVQCVVTGPIGTNSYIVWTHPVLVIDPGYGTGSIVREPCIVLLTHGHFDHVCGLKELDCEKVYISEPNGLKILASTFLCISTRISCWTRRWSF